MKRCSVLAVFSIWLAACSGPTFPLDARRLSTREATARSSAIAVGVVRKTTFYGPIRLTEAGVSTRTWRVEIDVWRVLKGHVNGSALTYFLNNYTPGIAQNGDFEWLAPGDRRVVFLTSYGGRLRAVSDLYGTSVPFLHATVLLSHAR